jgi:hypothetical protein
MFKWPIKSETNYVIIIYIGRYQEKYVIKVTNIDFQTFEFIIH